jgi:hypothetical protein
MRQNYLRTKHGIEWKKKRKQNDAMMDPSDYLLYESAHSTPCRIICSTSSQQYSDDACLFSEYEIT